MFDKHKAAEAELERHQAADRAAVAATQAYEALEAARLIHTAQVGIVFKKAEVAYFSIQGAALIEPRRAPGQWSGGSHGVSFRVAKGVSYLVGASRHTHPRQAEQHFHHCDTVHHVRGSFQLQSSKNRNCDRTPDIKRGSSTPHRHARSLTRPSSS